MADRSHDGRSAVVSAGRPVTGLFPGIALAAAVGVVALGIAALEARAFGHPIVEGLVVYPERMERNLWSSHGLFFSHRLLLALIEGGLERADAYRMVQRNAMRAWDEERDFAELVRADPEIAGRLDDAALAGVFDLAATIAHLDHTFDRLHRLVPKEEPAHA